MKTFMVSSCTFHSHAKIFGANIWTPSEVKVHIAILGAEIDRVAPPELVKHFGEILSAKSEVRKE